MFGEKEKASVQATHVAKCNVAKRIIVATRNNDYCSEK